MSDVTGKSPVGRRLKIALVISLAINLMAMGIVAGFIFKPHKDFHSPAMSFHQMTKELSPDGREIIKNIMKNHKDNLRTTMRQIHQQRRDISDLLAADTVDKPELEAAFERLKQLSADFQGELHQVMIESALQLPAEDRQKLQKSMLEKHNWKHKDKYREDGLPPRSPHDEMREKKASQNYAIP